MRYVPGGVFSRWNNPLTMNKKMFTWKNNIIDIGIRWRMCSLMLKLQGFVTWSAVQTVLLPIRFRVTFSFVGISSVAWLELVVFRQGFIVLTFKKDYSYFFPATLLVTSNIHLLTQFLHRFENLSIFFFYTSDYPLPSDLQLIDTSLYLNCLRNVQRQP